MRNLLYCSWLLLCLAACKTYRPHNANGLEAYVPASKEMQDTIAVLDSLLFGAYNHCQIDKFDSLLSADIEFYHDKGGLSTDKAALVQSIKNNICGKVQRELLPGSIEVYPIPGYGAVQMGVHRFHNLLEKSTSRYARFVHTWHHEAGRWKLARVISLH